MPTTSAVLRVFSSLIFSLATALTFAAPTSLIAIPATTNARYPGTLKLDIDVTDIERKIHKARLQIPVAPGPHTLLFPQWLPGNHAPNGVISLLSGLAIKANGNLLEWTRDTIQVFAFHLTAVSPAQGRVLVTPDIVNVQWNSVVLYPAGYNGDGIIVEATMTHPEGGQYAASINYFDGIRHLHLARVEGTKNRLSAVFSPLL